MYILIAAADSQLGIGKNNTLPWDFKEDMQFFHDQTTQNPNGKTNILIMGRKTYESIPKAHRPLKDRINIVISRTKQASDFPESQNLFFVESINKAIEKAEQVDACGQIFCIGGANIYNQFLERALIDQVLLTQVEGQFSCDAFLHDFRNDFILQSEQETICLNRQDQKKYKLRFQSYKLKN